MPLDPYASGVLDKNVHDRLVADIDNFARDAGVQPHWICSPLPPDVTKSEIGYLRKFRQHMASHGKVSGLCYTKKSGVDAIDQRMAAIAGCLVRNFIRARVMTLGSVLDTVAGQSMPQLTCLLIPNFFHPASDGGHIAAWQVSALYDLLLSRQIAGQQTIVYAPDLAALGKEYGMPMKNLIDQSFVKVGGSH
ncbi:MAG: hypothetical protein KJZ83_00260 [Burkholderiaceae bacterium]|nr:hypothetical protein [Burkholderiaceae bacterium]